MWWAGKRATIVSGQYFLILLKLVPGKTLTSELLAAHATHLAALDQSGRLAFAGLIPERPGGRIVLRVANISEAAAVAEEDPLVRGGYQTYEVGTWLLSNRRNSYRPDLKRERPQ